MHGRLVDMSSDHRTANNVPIVDGLPVWDKNLDLGTVNFRLSRAESEHFDGWYTIILQGGGRSLMNGGRLTTIHPFTHQRAVDALHNLS